MAPLFRQNRARIPLQGLPVLLFRTRGAGSTPLLGRMQGTGTGAACRGDQLRCWAARREIAPEQLAEGTSWRRVR